MPDPYLGNLINELMASQLQVITGVATTLIALIAGLSLNFERLGRRLTSIAHMTIVTIAVAIVGTRCVRMDRVAVAWTGARRSRPAAARHDPAARHHRRQLLADHDGGGHGGDRRPRAS